VSRFPKLSGKEIVNILVREFDFEATRQTGSHIILHKFVDEKKIVTVVPLHKEVKIGTLFGILALAKIEKEEFLKRL
jgi:predicted RNA binding protein YcfA (HicA-like mRNA interferase family)